MSGGMSGLFPYPHPQKRGLLESKYFKMIFPDQEL